jgi:sulfatase maturation enzyme AslB (radical SAM superfamily)
LRETEAEAWEAETIKYTRLSIVKKFMKWILQRLEIAQSRRKLGQNQSRPDHSRPRTQEVIPISCFHEKNTTPAVFTECAGAELSDSCAAVSCLPTTAVLELTAACNHKCLFCSCPWEAAAVNGFESRSELSATNWKEVVTMLCARGVSNIAFSGGEALLRKGVFDIIEHAASRVTTHIETHGGRLVREVRPPRLYLISNSTVITRETLLFLRDHGVQLSMSLPGLATLAEHTGIGDPDVVLSKFRMARELGMHTVVNCDRDAA